MLLLLFLAAMADLKTDRIPNGFIVIGIMTGVSGGLWYHSGLWNTVVSVFLTFLLMYPLFRIGVLGAGDVKVFIMISSFLSVSSFLAVLVSAFVIGAVFSLIKLLAERNGRERISYFLSYLSDVLRTRQWKLYGEHMAQDYEQYRRNKIHFTIPVLFSVVLRIGGLI